MSNAATQPTGATALSVPFPANVVAGLVLAARPHLERLGFSSPSATTLIEALGASRTTAYKARGALEALLPELLQPPGRPALDEPPPTLDARPLHARVRDFLFDHPGCVSGSALRRSYADRYRLFVLDLVAEQTEVPLSELAAVVGVPLSTLEDWLRGARPQVAPEPAAPAGPSVAHVESVLDAWASWDGGFSTFCDHVQRHRRLPLSRQHISDILAAHGIRIPASRRRAPDAAARRGAFEAFFPGAQWVGDGMELRIEVDGVPYFANLELNVDVASSALVGASVRPTEDAAAVVEALDDGVRTTGAPPVALLLDNKPSNHASAVADALGEGTLKLRARPYTPTDKPHVEGTFGLFSQEAPPLAVSSDPATLAAQVVALVFMTWARAVNHRPRADRGGKSRVELYRNARPTPEEIAQARQRLAERLATQQRARETRRRKQDPVTRRALDAAFERLALADPDGSLREALACWPKDAVLAGIALFEGKKRRGTLPDGVGAAYVRGIVVNLATEAECMAIADALLEERLRAQDHALQGLVRARDSLHRAADGDTPALVKSYTQRAIDARRQLDRHYWLRAVADVALGVPEHRLPLLRLAARHISTTRALRLRERNAAIRFLFAKAVPVA